MKKSKVTIECFEQDFECYLSPGDWNGWMLPNFEIDVAFELMEACNAITDMGGIKMLYDVENDTFYTDDGAESWKGFDYEGKHLYDIGSQSWCWWEVKDHATDKKKNMVYWDNIDDTTEDYVNAMLQCGNISTDDDGLMMATKEVVDLVTEYLTNKFGAKFPYVDENY